jgi:hypothetical protein
LLTLGSKRYKNLILPEPFVLPANGFLFYQINAEHLNSTTAFFDWVIYWWRKL